MRQSILKGLFFERSAKCWDVFSHVVFQGKKFREQECTWMELEPSDTVLDIGCGTGQLAAEIAQHTSFVVGLDGSLDMMAATKKYRSKNCVFVAGIAEKPPFKPRSFNAGVSSLMLHHVPPESKVFVLKELRTLITRMLLVADVARPKTRFLGLIGDLWRMLDFFEYTKEALTNSYPELFKQAGFHTIKEAGEWNKGFIRAYVLQK